MTDEQKNLLPALQAGNQRAWEEAFRLLYPCAFAAARRGNAAMGPDDLEDAAVEALSMVADHAGRVKSFDELKALTTAIAMRHAISLRRREMAQKRGAGQTGSLDALKEDSCGKFEPPGNEVSPNIGVELFELKEILTSAMSELDDLSRQLIAQFVLDGVSYRDLAAKHGKPVGTVGVLIYRGLVRIRQRFSQKPDLMKELRQFLR
ncbi:MAG: RNA polymerase sigma factor [Verrucomicrobiae bacterium]|nr:RNA polymerase sigma factor [Verrucomicrobiae bacterium]